MLPHFGLSLVWWLIVLGAGRCMQAYQYHDKICLRLVVGRANILDLKPLLRHQKPPRIRDFPVEYGSVGGFTKTSNLLPKNRFMFQPVSWAVRVACHVFKVSRNYHGGGATYVSTPQIQQ